MFARLGKSALRLGLSLVVVIPLFLAMISSASASKEITCTWILGPGDAPPAFTYEPVRQAGPNTFLTEFVTSKQDNNCAIGRTTLENERTIFSDGDFHARGWGVYEGRYWNGTTYTAPGTVTLRVVVNGSPVKAGLITPVFTFVDGTGGLAGLHGQITEVIDLRAGTDAVTMSYHFDP